MLVPLLLRSFVLSKSNELGDVVGEFGGEKSLID